MTAVAQPDQARRYELREQLQQSATGNLWRGWDGVMERDVDLRQLRAPAQLPDEQQRAILAHGARAAMRARAVLVPGLLPVFDVLTADDEVLVVTDVARGRWLSEVLREEGALEPARADLVVRRLAATLFGLHDKGLVHADLRPSRVLVDGDEVWLVAYGLDAAGENDAASALLGSPAYVSPQRAHGAAPTPEDDVWSLGVLGFALVEGSVPFSGHSVQEVLTAVGERPVPTPTKAPEPYAELVARMLDRDPTARPAAAEIARGPRRAPAAAPADAASPPAKAAGGKGRGAGVAVAVTVVVLLLLAWLVVTRL